MDNSLTGYWGNLTVEQSKALEEFMSYTRKAAVEVWKADLSQFDVYDYLRFLRARKFNLDKTIEMFQKYIKWRMDFGVDSILTYKFPEICRVKEIYPHGYHKTDKLMRPIYIERLGMVKLDELFKRTSKERIIKYYVREYEKLRQVIHPACSLAAGRKIETNLNIIDMTGGSSSLLAPKTYKFAKITASICQDYYPEMLGLMFFVNTSWLLRTAWGIVKGFMDAKTTAKIKILGSDYKKELLQHIAPENLPKFLGGECECSPEGCLNRCEGPWKPYLDKFPKDNDECDKHIPELPEKWKAI